MIHKTVNKPQKESKINKKGKIKRGLLATAVLITAYVLFVAVSIWSYGKIDQTRPADAAIILGAATVDGEPSPVFEERINHGIELYKSGYVNKLIFTGGQGDEARYSDASVARRYAVAKGVPAQDIRMEEKSRITEENILCAAELLEQNYWSTALIVSDPLHMKRAMRMATDYGLTAYASPTRTTMYQSLRTKIPFLAREVFFYVGYSMVNLF